MTNNLKKKILTYINNLLVLKGWENIDEPITFPTSKAFYTYLPKEVELINLLQNKDLSLLIETILAYDKAIEDDWLPDDILNLSIPYAYLFLKEIKEILDKNIPEKNIKEELTRRYHIIKKMQKSDKKVL